jgi:hypothetical protein
MSSCSHGIKKEGQSDTSELRKSGRRVNERPGSRHAPPPSPPPTDTKLLLAANLIGSDFQKGMTEALVKVVKSEGMTSYT